MHKLTTFDSLWGGIVARYQMDIEQHLFEMQILVLDGGEMSKCNLSCSGVTKIEFTDEVREPWEYIDLTSIEVKPALLRGEPAWRLEAELWSSMSRLTLECAEVRLNGVAVQRTVPSPEAADKGGKGRDEAKKGPRDNGR